jgi:hypothetical protein
MARARVFMLARFALRAAKWTAFRSVSSKRWGSAFRSSPRTCREFRRLIEDGRSGLLVAAGDASALADAIERLQREPALAQAIGAQARRRVESAFSLKRSVDALLAAWDETAAASAAQRTP